MLSKAQKQARITDLKKKMEKAVAAIVTAPNGIDVATSTAMRKKMRAGQIEFKVVKNTLAKIAAKGTMLELVADLFDKETAIVFGYADAVSPAKAVQDFIKEKPDRLKVRGGVAEGKKLDAKGVEALAKMPGLNEMRSILLGSVLSPGGNLAAAVRAPGAHLATLIQARVEQIKKETPAAA